MVRNSLCMALMLVGMAAPLNLAGAVEIRGAIQEVTVYRGQALVTRAVTVNQPQGLAEIIVTDLPEHVIADSLFAEAGDGLQVRSIRYRARPVMEDVNEEVRALDQRITELNEELVAVKRREQVLLEHKSYLGKLEGFVAPAATTELTHGVLNAETLARLTTMLLEQRKQVAEDELELAAEQRELQKRVEQATRERSAITRGSTRTAREAVVLVDIQRPREAELRVKYLVDHAHWSPSYTARAGGNGKNVTLEYYASIQQMTGEDWAGVSMTLSTATPSLAARAPQLKPMSISLGHAQPAEQTFADYSSAKMANMQQRAQVEEQRGRGDAGPGRRELDDSLNKIAEADLMLDLQAGERVTRTGSRQLQVAEQEGISVTYVLSGTTSLPSRNDRQQVQIASAVLEAEFYKLATPILTTAVYDEATTVNTSKLVLLSGPVAAYSDGRFVGSGVLPTVSIGESFILGFGIDSSLKARRELVERSESVQGGNRLIDLTYRLSLDNFGSEAAMVRLQDRIPKVQDQQIKLTLTGVMPELSQAVVEDARKEGVLRWDVAAPGQSFGAKAVSVEYKVRLEHDKQMVIAGLQG